MKIFIELPLIDHPIGFLKNDQGHIDTKNFYSRKKFKLFIIFDLL